MHLLNLMGLITFIGSFVLMLVTVPWSQIKRFAVFGVVSGLGIAVGLLIIMQNWLGVWSYRQIDLLYFKRIPLILSAAWTPTEIFFAHFLNNYQHPWLRLLLILFIPGIAVGIHFIQIWSQVLVYSHWNLFGTYLISLGIHWGLAYYLRKFHITIM